MISNDQLLNTIEKHAKSSNPAVSLSILKALKKGENDSHRVKPNIVNTDFVNGYGGERNKFQLLAFNLLGVDETLITKHFPECAQSILKERALIDEHRNAG